MRIGGLQKFSLIDYPGKVACIVFTQGCNFRCGYCHNPELVIPNQFSPAISEEKIFNFLRSRQEYLQGVVVSGGEPTLQKDLAVFLGKIKQLGYLIKLDTNGSHPDRLGRLIHSKLVDYIAMDVKTSLGRYQEMIDARVDGEKIRASIDIIIHSGLHHEFRTTVVKPYCSYDDLSEVQRMIQGSRRYRLQKIRLDDKILDKGILTQTHYSEDEFKHLQHIFQTDQPLEGEGSL